MLGKLKAWWNETEGDNREQDQQIERARTQSYHEILKKEKNRELEAKNETLNIALAEMRQRAADAAEAEKEAARKSSTLIHLLNLVEELKPKEDMTKYLSVLEQVKNSEDSTLDYVVFSVEFNDFYDEMEIIDEVGLRGVKKWDDESIYRDYGFRKIKHVWACQASEYFTVVLEKDRKEIGDFIQNVITKAVAKVEEHQKNSEYIPIIEQYEKPLSTIVQIVIDSKRDLGEVNQEVFEGVKKITLQIIKDIKNKEELIEEQKEQIKKEKAEQLKERIKLEMDYVDNFISAVIEKSEDVELPEIINKVDLPFDDSTQYEPKMLPVGDIEYQLPPTMKGEE